MRTGNLKESYAELVVLNDSPSSWAWLVLLLLALLVVPLLVGNYAISLFTGALIAVVGAVGLNLLTGTTGLISIGQSAFLAIGAYANGLLITDYHWPLWAALPAAGVISAAISLLVGIPSLRLRGLYLAITTLAFVFIVDHIILYAEPITHGSNGLFLPKLTVFGFDLSKDAVFYYFTLVLTIVVILVALNLLRSRIGRAWLALRDHDIAARVMGIDLTRYKLLAFMVSSFIVGIAGALMSLRLRFVNIDVFTLLLSIEALAMIILGGIGSIPGAVLGAAFLSLLPEIIRIVFSQFGDPNSGFYSTYVFEIRGIVYGVVIVLFLRFKPDGLIGLWRDTKKYWSNWPLAY